MRFKAAERNIFLHILTACNLSCKHCYINKEQHGSRQLDKKEIADWLRLFAAPEKTSNIIFLGGEPTLHPDLAASIILAKELGYQVTVDSNGYLFHDLLEKVTPQQLDYLSFSLDGPDALVNDPVRGSGVFATCTANIRRAIEKGFAVSVIYTVSRKNIAHLHRMGDLLLSLGVRKFFIQVLGLRGKSAAADSEATSQVNRREWLATVPAVAASIARRGIHVTYPKVFLEDGEPFECAGNVAENYFVFPNGRVYQCPLCEDYPLHNYQIADGKLVKMEGLREESFFNLAIAEGCVMNKLLQPDTIEYGSNGKVRFRISCCLLKQEVGNPG
ncbi:MAG: heme biosynthesis protein [Acidobacteria bacterium]|nr:MAG: heme biosynthesis protein [Acidobacteriota bacterium]